MGEAGQAEAGTWLPVVSVRRILPTQAKEEHQAYSQLAFNELHFLSKALGRGWGGALSGGRAQSLSGLGEGIQGKARKRQEGAVVLKAGLVQDPGPKNARQAPRSLHLVQELGEITRFIAGPWPCKLPSPALASQIRKLRPRKSSSCDSHSKSPLTQSCY